MTIHLGRLLPDASRDLPGWRPGNMPAAQGGAIPIWSCSRWGLPCRFCYQPRGALLPHPFTLTLFTKGGLLSVALSLGLPPPGITRHRVFVEPGLSSPAKRERPSSHLTKHISGAIPATSSQELFQDRHCLSIRHAVYLRRTEMPLKCGDNSAGLRAINSSLRNVIAEAGEGLLQS